MFGLNQQYEDFYKEVFEKYSQFIFSHIISKVGKRVDALDIAQNVFVHLWQYRKDLKFKNVEAILLKSCRQEIFKFYKDQIGKGISVSIDGLGIEIEDHSELDLEEKLEKERKLNAIYEALNLIPIERKKIFLLNKIEGKTRKEIAMELNMSKSAIGNQIDKTMQFLIGKLRR
ncbi:RNA polymerase sigma factor [Chryseobacterium populi]|uniref:RNA polymerase sigma factor, sigma-70 family n=1 Tax=Chryseobacterium populi TaxID=1144316 RepID=J2T8J0_9FLAO|nr:sigma-70 family RNA polymerase sigma factor [Chryseobacterium populi]EJL74412.1 RNA polymerase sigma factor, sigma-70 family [Chryseobacterium populi]